MKNGIIVTSILLAVLALIGVLFGAVFRVRTVSVRLVGDFTPPASTDIIKSSNIKYGTSIFGVDKEVISSNIEREYPGLKVVQIKTTSVTSLEIVIRERVAMFRADLGDNIYILDEDLKVLDIFDNKEELETNPQLANLITITDNGQNLLGLSEQTQVTDFLGGNYVRNVIYNLFVAMYESVTIPSADGYTYLERSEICELIDNVDFEKERNTIILTLNETALNEFYSVGFPVEIVICEPNAGLKNKVRICFCAIPNIINEENKTLVITYTDKAGYSFK